MDVDAVFFALGGVVEGGGGSLEFGDGGLDRGGGLPTEGLPRRLCVVVSPF